MIKYSLITLFPELIENYCSTSIVGRAQRNKLITVETINPRIFTTDVHRTVDDTPYGGGSGMVLMCDPVFSAVESINRTSNSKLIYTTPQGKPLNQELASSLLKYDHLIIICGHYEGIDERIIDALKPEEISIGDFVLTGGELAALCIIDATSRLISGVLGKEDSIKEETFNQNLLEYPHYTRPVEYRGMRVPDVLISGHHKNSTTWRKQQSIIRTYLKRPDLIKNANLTDQEKEFLRNYILSLEKE